MQDIEGYEGLYAITENGKVWSYRRVRIGMRRPYKARWLKLQKYSNGYFYVTLCKDGIYKRHKVNRLVACAFIPNPLRKSQVNHKNGVKTDDRKDNLEWATPRENVRHSITTGLRKPVLSTEQKRQIRAAYAFRKPGHGADTIAKQYGVSPPTILKVIKATNHQPNHL